MKRFVAKLALLVASMTALATPALAIGTWPTPESPAFYFGSFLRLFLW